MKVLSVVSVFLYFFLFLRFLFLYKNILFFFFFFYNYNDSRLNSFHRTLKKEERLCFLDCFNSYRLFHIFAMRVDY